MRAAVLRHWSRRSLQARIVLLVALGMLGPVAIFAWTGWRSFTELSQELLAERQLLAKSVADHLELVIKADLEVLQAIGSAPRNGGEAARGAGDRASVRDAYLRSRVLEAVLLLGPDGTILWEEPQRLRHADPQLGGLPIVRDVLRTGRPEVSGLVDEPGGAKRLYLLVPLRDWEGRVVRVAVGGIDPDRFTALLQPFRVGERGSTDLIDSRGTVIATTDASRRYTQGDHGQFIAGLIRERKPAAGTCHGCHGPSVVRGRVREVLAFVPLSVVPWGIAIRQPEAEAFAALAALRRRLLILGPGVFALAAFFAWGAARSIRKPLRVITRAAERIAAGEMGQAIPPLGEDEVGRLGRSLERMREALKESMEAIGRANQDLEGRVEQRTRELERLYRELSEREQARARLLRKVIGAQEEERKRVARELHDETSQSLTALVMGLETALTTLPQGAARDRLQEIKAIAVRALEELHLLLLDLRPSVLDDLGLMSAIRWCAERHLKPLGIAVRCEFAGLEHRFPPEVETALFRVVQEAVTNIAKHAEAETVLIQCTAAEGQVTIEIEDDGKGFEPQTLTPSREAGTGLGLTGMRERVELLGGTVEIESAPEQGTRIVLSVPLGKETDDG